MNFAHPFIAAAAALSVAIPILIHLLLRFRRRPSPWAAMRFLVEAYQRQKRRLRLQQFLLLAARCLLLLSAGLAIARPFAGDADASDGASDVYILFDNSLTAQLRDGDGERAVDRHARAAQELIKSLGPGDRAALTPLAGPEASGVLPPSGDLSGVSALAGDLEAVDAPADLEGALRRVRSAMEATPGASARIVLLSECRRGLLPEGETPGRVFTDGSGASVAVRGRAEAPASNVQIVEVDPQRALVFEGGARMTVRVRLRRFGPAVDREGTTLVRASHTFEDGRVSPTDAGRVSASWAPGQSEQDVFLSVQSPAEEGVVSALAVSIDRDGLPGDDARWAPIAVTEGARVGVVDRASGGTGGALTSARWLELALQPDRSSRLQPVTLDPTSLDRTALAGLDGVFVLRPDLLTADGWEALSGFVASGRGTAVFPPANLDAHPWVDLARERLGLSVVMGADRVEHEEAVSLSAPSEGRGGYLRMLGSELDELLAPVRVFSSLALRPDASADEVVLATSEGGAWVVRARAEGGGEVVLFSSALSLEWSTLGATPLMVPLMQEVVRESVGASVRRRRVEAGTPPALPKGAAELLPVRGGEAVLPNESGVWPRLVRAGVYRVRGERGEDLASLSVSPAARGGDTGALSDEELNSWLGSAGVARIDRGNQGGESVVAAGGESGRLGVSAWVFLFALALAVLETYMARRFSPAGGGR